MKAAWLILAVAYCIVMVALPDCRKRVFAILTGLDAFVFCIVCMGNVKQGECASSAAWDCLLAGKWQGIFVGVIDWIFRDPEHCKHSWQWQNHLYKDTP